MIWLTIGLILVAVFLMVIRWLTRINPEKARKTLKSVAFIAGGGFLMLFLWRQRLIFFPLVSLLRARPELRSRPQQQPFTIRTDTLEMRSEPGGTLPDGKILAGEFNGHSLSQLSLDNLRNLFAYCQTHDHRAALVLETYLHQRFGSQWHHPAAERSHYGPFHSAARHSRDITHSEACQILGLDPRASKDDIIAAHRRLIRQLHPDYKKGDTQSAARVNRARDVLLGWG